MTTRTVAAMFKSRTDAENAVQQLVSTLGVDSGAVRTSPEAGATDLGYDRTQPYRETGFFASLKNLFLPEEDRYAFSEGMRRGHILVSVQVDESEVDRAADVMERAGALDLDAEEANWRRSGWTAYDASAARGAMTSTAATLSTTTQAGGQEEVIPLAAEELVVGKRTVGGGRVRVRTYVVERPVEAQVTLREERVEIERHPVNRPLTDRDREAFRERVVEVTETREEAVVGKEARIVEEVAVHKTVEDHTETVRDTVRRTEIEVDNESNRATAGTVKGDIPPGATSSRAAGASMGGYSGSDAPDGTPGNPPGTMASRAADRTLGTNVSGAHPENENPDGTPGNPPGTMLSRAADDVLGTNMSGARPENENPDGTPGNPPGTQASRAVDRTLGTNTSGANPGNRKG